MKWLDNFVFGEGGRKRERAHTFGVSNRQETMWVLWNVERRRLAEVPFGTVCNVVWWAVCGAAVFYLVAEGADALGIANEDSSPDAMAVVGAFCGVVLRDLSRR